MAEKVAEMGGIFETELFRSKLHLFFVFFDFLVISSRVRWEGALSPSSLSVWTT